MNKTARSVVARVGIVLMAVTVVCVGVYWKLGALHGTFEANLWARANMLANEPAFRMPDRFKLLCADPTASELSDLAEIWIGPASDRRVLWRSPNLGETDLLIQPGKKLFSIKRGNGQGFYGVSIVVPPASVDEQPLTVTYLTSRAPYLEDAVHTGSVLAFFGILPVLLAAVFCPPGLFHRAS